MANVLAVFLGGGLGSLLRYALSVWIPVTKDMVFPWATFIANVCASLILGLLVGISVRTPFDQRTQLFLLVGFCGGFSTFSTFSKEAFALLERGAYLQTLIYILTSIGVCVAAMAWGYYYTHK